MHTNQTVGNLVDAILAFNADLDIARNTIDGTYRVVVTYRNMDFAYRDESLGAALTRALADLNNE